MKDFFDTQGERLKGPKHEILYFDYSEKRERMIKRTLNKSVPLPVRMAIFVLFVMLVLLWFSGYFGF